MSLYIWICFCSQCGHNSLKGVGSQYSLTPGHQVFLSISLLESQLLTKQNLSPSPCRWHWCYILISIVYGVSHIAYIFRHIYWGISILPGLLLLRDSNVWLLWPATLPWHGCWFKPLKSHVQTSVKGLMASSFWTHDLLVLSLQTSVFTMNYNRAFDH